MSAPRNEIAPEHGPDGEHNPILRGGETAPEQRERVAKALNAIAHSDAADTLVDAMGLKTHLDDPNNPVRTFLVNANPQRLRLFFETAFKRAQEMLQKSNDVEGQLALRGTRNDVFAALDANGPERTQDQRRAA